MVLPVKFMRESCMSENEEISGNARLCPDAKGKDMTDVNGDPCDECFMKQQQKKKWGERERGK